MIDAAFQSVANEIEKIIDPPENNVVALAGVTTIVPSMKKPPGSDIRGLRRFQFR